MGVGVSGCSRPTIEKVRNAFVEVIKESVAEQVAWIASAAVKAQSAACALAASPPSVSSAAVALVLSSVALLHIHDEASLRLRPATET